MAADGMSAEEFEEIQSRVAAALASDGSFKANMDGSNYKAVVGRDVQALITEVERLRAKE